MTNEEIKDIAAEAAASTLAGKVMELPNEEPVTPEDEEDEPCECEKLKPMAEWFSEQDEDGKVCHECIALPIAEYYLGALEQAKAEPQIKQLQEAWATEQLSVIGEAMDKIKSEVDEYLKKRLLTYDCYAQTFEMPHEIEEVDEGENSTEEVEEQQKAVG